MTPVRTPPARYRRTDNNSGRRRRGGGRASSRAAEADDVARIAIVVGLWRVSGGRERRAVEDARGFVADLLEHPANGAVVLGHAFLAGCVRGLADAGNQGQRAV